MFCAKNGKQLGIVGLWCAAFGCNSPDAQVGSSAGGQGGGDPGSTGTTVSAGPGGSGPSSTGNGGAGPTSTGIGGAGPTSTGIGGAGPSSTGSGGQTGSGGTGSGLAAAWAKKSTESSATEETIGVSTDIAGNVFLAGYFSNAINFGSGIITATAGGYSDIFLAKFTETGQNLWTKSWGDAEEQHAYGMVADANRIIIAGYYEGTPSFGTGMLPLSDWWGDIFVAAFDVNGTGAWAKSYGIDGYSEYAYGIALDAADNVLLTGKFESSLNFGTPPLTSAGGEDIFVAKLDPMGNTIWSKSFGDTGYWQVGYGITSDSQSRVIITGKFDGTVNFGGMPLTASGSDDLFVAAFDSNGSHLWSRKFVSGNGVVEYPVIATDSSGGILVAGYYSGYLDFGMGAFGDQGDYDTFIAKLDPFDGKTIWVKSFGQLGTLTGMSNLAVDSGDGSVWLSGFLRGTVDYGGGPITSNGTCMPGEFCNDISLVKLDSSGNHLFSRRYGDTANDRPSAIALTSNGSPVLTGNYSLNMDFGNNVTLMGNYSDIFLVKFQ